MKVNVNIWVKIDQQFFKQQHEYLCEQRNPLQSSVVNDSASKNPLLLSTFKIAHVLMKRHFTKLSL